MSQTPAQVTTLQRQRCDAQSWIFLGIVREQHDLVAMFGKEYQARNDNARRRAT
jgi:hypothetical protein